MPRIFTLIIIFLYQIPLVISQIQLLNDEFNDSRSLINWNNINIVENWGIEQLEHYSINDSITGKLVMIPRTASWFGGWRGPLLYREVSGNFVVTIKVDAVGRDSSMPAWDFNLAGIMIRHVRAYPNGALGTGGWSAADNNYMFLSIGAAGAHNSCPGCSAPNFEVKNTTDGTSNLRVIEVDTLSTQIRVARSDSAFVIMYRLETDQTWVVHQRYARSDFPDTIQVGLVTYTDWQKVFSYAPATHNQTQIEGSECNSGPDCNPDIVGQFEFIRFDSLNVPMGIGSDFTDTNDVTDSELLSFLSYDSEHYCPSVQLIDAPIDSNTYQLVQASESIVMSDSVMNNSVLVLSAPDSVNLMNDFTSGQNTIIEIDNIGCNP